MGNSRKKNTFPKRYTAGLSRKDKIAQVKALRRSKKSYRTKKGSRRYVSRPKLRSFKNKKSGWTQKFHKLYPEAKTLEQVADTTGIPLGALKQVQKKGRGAYYSSGSRPNQTAESWGKARMYSYILGGPTRKVDQEVTKNYRVKFKHKSSV